MGNTLAHRQVGSAGARGRKEKNSRPCECLRQGGEIPLPKEIAGRGQQETGEPIGPGDHRFSADRVEESSQQERAEKIADGEWKNVEADVAARHIVELGEHKRIRK